MAGVVKTFGGLARAAGKALDRLGASLEAAPYFEHLNPSTRVVSYQGVQPKISGSVFVAPTATIIGEVQIGEGSSVMYGATIRADVNNIAIGQNTTVGDRAILHVAKIQGDAPTIIGDHVLVGPNAVIHACELKDECFIGAGASVLDNAVVEKHAWVAPGAIVTMGVTVPSGQLWAGVPAKAVRDLTEEEISSIKATALENVALAETHRLEQEKKVDQVVLEEHLHQCDEEREPEMGPRFDPAGDEWRKRKLPEPPAPTHEEIYYGPSKTATRFN
uniref:Carbonic anhydrase n=1 Tax=Pinguiococcus pyrenoidosus TaxID=172671 RepID=A0A7R9U2D6_9STRA